MRGAPRGPRRARVRRSTPGRPAALLLAALLPLALWPGAQLHAEPGLERTEALPPGLPDWLPALLDPAGYRVIRDEGAPVDFWFPPELPMQDPSAELGVEYPTLPPGSLVGLMLTTDDWSTYKKQIVPAGAYTLRYAVQPADGDHTGQTWFRDFLVLVPVALDTFDPHGFVEQEPLVEASITIIEGATHPMTMALFQNYDGAEEATMFWNDLDQPTLAVPLGGVTLGLVIVGEGEEVPL